MPAGAWLHGGMKSMKSVFYAAAAFFSLSLCAHATSLTDPDAILVCAVVDLTSCVPGDGCERETADTMNAPQLVTVDRKAQEITGQRPGGQLLSTKIDRAALEQDLLVLDGVQDELSWTMTIVGASGRMSLAAVGDGKAFAVFGSCETK
jgi:hypothetical protein